MFPDPGPINTPLSQFFQVARRLTNSKARQSAHFPDHAFGQALTRAAGAPEERRVYRSRPIEGPSHLIGGQDISCLKPRLSCTCRFAPGSFPGVCSLKAQQQSTRARCLAYFLKPCDRRTGPPSQTK